MYKHANRTQSGTCLDAGPAFRVPLQEPPADGDHRLHEVVLPLARHLLQQQPQPGTHPRLRERPGGDLRGRNGRQTQLERVAVDRLGAPLEEVEEPGEELELDQVGDPDTLAVEQECQQLLGVGGNRLLVLEERGVERQEVLEDQGFDLGAGDGLLGGGVGRGGLGGGGGAVQQEEERVAEDLEAHEAAVAVLAGAVQTRQDGEYLGDRGGFRVLRFPGFGSRKKGGFTTRRQAILGPRPQTVM
jgi:hypothetical protein